MAFRMTRPTIQGTEYHKASVLKAKAETVAQTRTAADPTLVATGSELGRSYIPKAIDFTIKPTEIKIPEGDGKKKEVEPKVEATKLDPKPIRPLPTTKAKEELSKATGSVDNYIYQQGRFEKAAQEFGFNISQEKINHVKEVETVDAEGNTVIKEVNTGRLETDKERDQRVRKNYEAAQEAMKYNDPGADAIAAGVKEGWQNPQGNIGGAVDSKTVLTPEQQAQVDKDAKNQAEVDKMNAEKLAEIDAREARKEKDYQDRLRKAQEEKDQKAKELEEKNKAIREQNKAIVEAKKFYGITGDGKLTQPQLDEYRNMIKSRAENEAKYQQNPIEIEEESDREWNQAPPGRETVSNRSDLQKGGKIMDVDSNTIPDFIQKPTQVKQDVKPTTTTTSQTTQNAATTKPKLSDFKDGKNAFGGYMSKNQAYNEAMRKWRRENPNPIQMRDDAIYKNAIKDGVVQRNMIKSGYKPLD
jgi:hypothetical protein